MYYVYILECSDNTLYTGITTDLTRRVHEHNATSRAATYTAARRPVVLRYQEGVANLSAALRRERAIKKLKRFEKIQLINK